MGSVCEEARPPTVLVIDSEPQIVELVARILSMTGYSVVQAFRAEDAIRLFDPSSIDLVIADVDLPDVDGARLTNRLRAAAPRLPVLHMSGVEGDGERPDYLKKPFHLDELRQKVVLLLRAHCGSLS